MKHEYLTSRGKELLKELSEYAKGQGIEIKEARLHEIAMLANAISIYEDLAKFITKHGTIQAASSGYRVVSPEYSNMLKTYDQILKHSDRLGFYKIEKQEKKDDKNPIKELLKKSN